MPALCHDGFVTHSFEADGAHKSMVSVGIVVVVAGSVVVIAIIII